ncbi:MAG: type II secretion system F family protein, partial [Sulfuriferula sp.]
MRYEVKALRGNEGPTAIALDAADIGDATAQAMAQGYTVIAVKAQQSLHSWQQPRKTKFPLVLFSQELLTLLDAGLALVEALETLAEKEQRPEIKKTLSQVVTHLYEGHSLSYALQHAEVSFPPLYIA